MFSDRHAGRVYLVGAGPGDPGLMTLRGVEFLRRADVVLYDYLVNPRVLEHAAAHAELVCLGHHGRDRIVPQEEINQRLIDEARGGRCVVRLKGGDPAIFARTAEETEALAAAGVPFEIVPGVTAALAAASYTGIPLTHRELSSAVALVTGQTAGEENDEHPSLDYRQLATFPGTLVFYMGVTTAKVWSAGLIAGGMAPDTPVAAVRRATWPEQLILRCTLAEVADEMATRKLRPPVILIVGAVAGLAADHSWFTQRPLFGVRVLVTRPAVRPLAGRASDGDASDSSGSQPSLGGASPRWRVGLTGGHVNALASQLEELGAEVLLQPAIEIGPPDDWGPLDGALARLSEFDWLVFSSANGVRAVLERLLRHSCDSGPVTSDLPADLRRLGQIKLAVIGPGTAEELARYHLHPDLQPDEYRAEALAAALAKDARGRRFLLARASRGREVLAEELTKAGGLVEEVVCYRSRDVTTADPRIAAELAAGQIDWITVTSSAIARSLVALFCDDLRKAKLASISPVTSATLRELGFEPAAEAREYTMPGLVAAIEAAATA